MRLILLYILKGEYRANRKMNASSRKKIICYIYYRYILLLTRLFNTSNGNNKNHSHYLYYYYYFIERTPNNLMYNVHSKASQIPGRQDKGRRARGNFESHVINRRKMKGKISDQFFLLLSVYRWKENVDSFYNHKTIEDLAMNLSTKVHGAVQFFFLFCSVFLSLLCRIFFIILLDAPFLSKDLTMSIHAMQKSFLPFSAFSHLFKYPQNRIQFTSNCVPLEFE